MCNCNKVFVLGGRAGRGKRVLAMTVTWCERYGGLLPIFRE